MLAGWNCQSGSGSESEPVWFPRLDHDGDGKLSPEEFPYPLARLFKRFDLDGDGALSPTEAADIKATGQVPPTSPDTSSTDGQTVDSSFDLNTRRHGEEAKQAGINPDVLAKLDAALQRAVEDSEVSGVIGLIYRNGHRGYFEAFGWQDIEAKKPLAKDAIFRLQSMSKPVVAACAMAAPMTRVCSRSMSRFQALPRMGRAEVLENGQLVPGSLITAYAHEPTTAASTTATSRKAHSLAVPPATQ
ncbi:MAG: serine hydrolase [Planctomycetaceae bacterium]